MGRRDVVAVGCKDHKRVCNATQIDMATLTDLDLPQLEAVAHKQVLDNGDDLFPAQEIEAVPPALELQEPLPLAVDVSEEVGVLLPHGLGLQVLEVLNEPSAVEPSHAEVREEVNEPRAAAKAAGDPHRIDPGLTGPVRQRGAVEHRRSDQAGAVGG